MFKLILAILTLGSLSAQAALVLPGAPSKWAFVEETDIYLKTPICRAFAEATKTEAPIELSIGYPKDGKILPFIAIRTKLAPASIAVKVSKTTLEYFFLLQAGARERRKIFMVRSRQLQRL
jgi:hypothetical protein